MNNIVIRKALASEANTLKNLYQLYQYDFTEMNFDDVNSLGLYVEDFDIDIYFNDPDKSVYFILVDNFLAGFILMNKYPYLLPEKVNSIAEFFVMRKYRKQGVGMYAAKYIFSKYPGRMIIEVVKYNFNGVKFWDKAINEYGVKSHECTEEKHKGVDWFIHDIVI